MATIYDYDDIRPYLTEELPEAFRQLLGNPQFQKVVETVMPGVPYQQFCRKVMAQQTCLDFQLNIGHSFVEQLLQQHSTGIEVDFGINDIVHKRHTFVSNHRDIVLDSAILAKLLVDNGSPTTCEIAIGDNLLSIPWVRTLVRINKSFIVNRSLPPREMLQASRHLSEYIHFVVSQKQDNVWIAQREGRAKDGNDLTQPAIIKMLALAPDGLSPLQRLMQLHIVPLAINYEYDPCDYLKVREMQLKRDDSTWKKSSADDVLSMQTGLTGYKGRIAYGCAPCIDNVLQQMEEANREQTVGKPTNRHAVYEQVAALIDRQIHRSYTIFASQAVAHDMLKTLQGDNTDYTAGVPSDRFVGYTEGDVSTFTDYMQQQLKRVELPQRDESFLKLQFLTMYANPYRNYLRQWSAPKR